MIWLRKSRGWWRLHYRCCPLCNSSPPLRYCPVCHGSYEYGPKITPESREAWWDTFTYLVDAKDFAFLYPHRKGWNRPPNDDKIC